ncbi:hypothetical protein FJV41_42325 [Myxococcus llanfairpwllgwyngyllgogerychwyrndrobwllllantysiliogogogochensis]|uniref:Lipoprotein n=1 Tax=Myxococcus llanfairpwllgwyngyllgogerychwyrndrobwllllantysiliogogogochensis TaxID=2590453 RepID=A0A540WN71_9BACT|nr:hypothetical protein [Myxococcus llanfairpwllgwyngyllgogerychwyrndrobwllllantysiliogogogochensis]TQF09884.1 hypothetical protein FJV41_42325 [Myxococcus llanfairpwllgwyngyllgogerychwyrndrobwllllantysiliogogogochensis]
MERFQRWAWGVVGVTLLAGAGCAHQAPLAVRREVEAEKCSLIQSVLKEPTPSRVVEEIAAQGRHEPTPVRVYVRRPEQSMLERFFEGDEPRCGDATFKVVQESVLDAVVVYLQEVREGYAYDARRSGPDELTLEGTPQGTLKRAGPQWVAGK